MTQALANAITAFEQSDAATQAAKSTTMADQALADTAQAKADSAKALVATDQAAQDAAVANEKATLQAIIDAARAELAAL